MGEKVQIKDHYFIAYMDEWLNQEYIPINFFAKEDFSSSKLFRKYLNDTSRRAYYPDGHKQWFYTLLFHYEVRVKKSDLILNVEKSGYSYIYYNLPNGLEIINSTSGGSNIGEEGSCDWQFGDIHHCKKVTKSFLKKISEYAEDNPGEISQSLQPVYFAGNIPQIMFIQKYAQGMTDFNKTYRSCHRFCRSNDALINDILSDGVVPGKFVEYEFHAGHSPRYEEIKADMIRWGEMARAINSNECFSLPEELFVAFYDLRNMKSKAA